ncbi:MAG: hypothetical protein AB4042_00900 [Leptolyngbyaceae cyanobacterium]
MKTPWRYWRWVRLTLDGQRQVQELQSCHDWLQTQGLESDAGVVSDRSIQQRLMAILPSAPQPAEGCLRCFISHAIDRTCQDLFTRFGRKAGLANVEELLVFVLTDVDPLRQRPTTPTLEQDPSCAGKVLRCFKAEKAQLTTWTKRMVMSDRPLNQYLQEHGVYLDSDWSLLNSLSESKLRRLLTESLKASEADLDRAVTLLEGYRSVYRRDRLLARAQKGDGGNGAVNRSRCEAPTSDQLVRIVEFLQDKGIDDLDPEAVLAELEAWAQMIRQKRCPPTVSLEEPRLQRAIATVASDEADQRADQEDEAQQQQFLQDYRKVLLDTLDEAIAQVLEQRIAHLAQSNPPKDKAFADGLYRFICKGESMGAIAPQVGLKHQYQVTRLLNIKALRADIRRQVQLALVQRIQDLAHQYAEADRLDQLLEQVLDRELERLVAESEAESFTAHASNRCLLNQRLYSILIHWSDHHE